MTDKPARRWSPVREQAADALWIVLIVSMSVTVLATRMFLELTGYPQVGDSTFHVAHVLWGGLLLFVAIALQMSLVNRYALWLAAILGGVGAGLFIDEVGKFITQSNDYFFPLAFPIIYGFVLICVWFFWRLRRHRPRDSRTLLYHSLSDMKQVLDNDLDPFEHRELLTELKLALTEATDPNERRLAEALLDFVQSRELRLAIQPNRIERFMEATRARLSNTPPQWVLRAVLLAGLVLIAANAVAKLAGLIGLSEGASPFHSAVAQVVVVSGKSKYVVENPTALLIATLITIVAGLLAGVAAVLLVLQRDKWALRVGVLSLLISLCIVNFLTFYFLQLYALLETAGQVALLVVATIYRWRFLDVTKRQPVAALPTAVPG